MTVENEEVKQAINTLRVAGYYVIPREKVTEVTGQQMVDDMALAQYANRDGFMEHIYRRMFTDMALELARPGVAFLQDFKTKGADFQTTFRATVTVVPHSIAVDPMLEMLRQEQARYARRV